MVVVAVRPFEHQDCPVLPGDVCLVEPAEAAALIYRGHVKWPDSSEGYGVYHRRDILPQEPTKPRQRRSRRKDIVAAE
jgi:hypothetical protein